MAEGAEGPQAEGAQGPQWKEVGKVVSFFAHPSVAIVELTGGPLKVGDQIRIAGHTTNFEQVVESMELEHQSMQEGSVGQSIGIKVKERVRKNDVVYTA